ncbi:MULTISPECIES: hypothetical protein [Desulfitobacterium]|uniref:Uncharacterized protein n=1 Tax=Desulfitobacterium dehalogenans (strain ATCC 51507 / DSM 9161 / JW/IU-DC1) TaxID=756499 RepID=I4A627_DESDJ|nr:MULTISPECIES: hypothetical protein [Desulfitobacterium]AFL99411.1 hypothetical protein Desde_0976 [Desulfitobacterium dehalogenans ATCC 51507]
MDQLILMVLAFGLVSIGITVLLGIGVSRIKFLKYLPGVLCLFLSMYYYYLASVVRAGEGFEDLGNFILAIFFFAAAFFGIITALIMEYRGRSKGSR